MILPGALEKLEADLESIGCSTGQISDIYLTHVHTDHCGMAGILQDKSKANLHLSEVAHQVHSHFQRVDELIGQARLFQSTVCRPVTWRPLLKRSKTSAAGFRNLKFNPRVTMRSAVSAAVARSFSRRHAPSCLFFLPDEASAGWRSHSALHSAQSSPNIYDEVFQPLPSYLQSLAIIGKMLIDTVHPVSAIPFPVWKSDPGIRAHHELKKKRCKVSDGPPKTTFEVCSDIIGNAAANGTTGKIHGAQRYVCIQALKHEG